jgi:hypothetical protein
MTEDTKTINWGKMAAFGLVTILALGGVAYGVTYLWNLRYGPTAASAADCRIAQQQIDQAQSAPTDPAQKDAWKTELRRVRSTQMEDLGLVTEIAFYVAWKVNVASGEGDLPTDEEFKERVDRAIGACEDSGVELKIPGLRK